jgi:hypothetical protein
VSRALVTLAMVAAACAATSPVVTDPVPIDLHPGITLVPAFAPDGRAAAITFAFPATSEAASFR